MKIGTIKRNSYFIVGGNLATLSVFLIGYSNWLEANNISESTASYLKPVCYIGNKYYTNIGRAISESRSGDVIYVIPGNTDKNNKDYTIKSFSGVNSIIIPEGVTLNIPYGDNTTYSPKADVTNARHALGLSKTSPKTIVCLDDGLTLINNGTIEIGGEISAGSGGHETSYTTDNYSAFLLGANSRLENHGILNIYGLLGETSKENNSQIVSINDNNLQINPEIRMPFYWNDFGGGTALKAIYDNISQKYCIPLDDFYLENVTPKLTVYGGTDIYGWVNLYAASMYGYYEMKLVGEANDSIISLKSPNYYFESNYDEDTLINNLDFYGGAAFNALTIDVKKAITDIAGNLGWLGAVVAGIPEEVTSTEGYFPLTYHFNISLNTLNDGTEAFYDGSSNRYKLMNASNLIINNGATLKVDSLVVYDGSDYLTGRGTNANSLKKTITSFPDLQLKEATCIVNGNLSGNLIAGFFDTSSENASITVTNENSTIMYEPKGGQDNNVTEWFEIPLSLSLRNEEGVDSVVTSLGKYISEFNEYYYWKSDASKIINSVKISSSDGNYTTEAGKSGTFSLLAVFSPEGYSEPTNIEYYWEVKSENQNNSNSGAIFEDTGTNFSSISNPNLIVSENDSDQDIVYDVNLNVVIHYGEDNSISLSSGATKITAAKPPECFNGDALVFTNIGLKKIRDLTMLDKVYSYNHFKGKIELSNLIGIFKHKISLCTEEILYFENNLTIKFLNGHDLFDCELKKYVNLKGENIKKYIGHKFLMLNSNKKIVQPTKLLSFKVNKKIDTPYSLLTEKNLNAIVDSLITLTPLNPCIANVFDYNNEFNVDLNKLNYDIKRFGLLSYKDWSNYVSEYMFESFNAKYIKIGICKGQFTENELLELIKLHKKLFDEKEMIVPGAMFNKNV